jgi:hypothetical protein
MKKELTIYNCASYKISDPGAEGHHHDDCMEVRVARNPKRAIFVQSSRCEYP